MSKTIVASEGLSDQAWAMIEEALIHGTITLVNHEGQARRETLRSDDVLSLAQWLALHQPRKRRTVPRPEDFYATPVQTPKGAD